MSLDLTRKPRMSGSIAIIDYQMGNLRSVQKALEHVGAEAEITNDPKRLAAADKLILPGVGAFGDAIREIRERGLIGPIQEAIDSGKPFLGICLGLQLLFDVSYEGGTHQGLGIIPGEVVRFELPKTMKVPHMGWNSIVARQPDVPLMNELTDGTHVYFVHSYYVVPKDRDVIWLEADYGGNFCAAIRRGNLFATQFHPEKSQKAGLQLLRNFAQL